MRSKLDFLTTQSLKRKIKSKWFLVANIIIAIALIALANVDTIIKQFGGDFNKKQIIYVEDNTNSTYSTFKNIAEKYEDLSNQSVQPFIVKKANKTAKELLKDKNEDAWFLIFNKSNNIIDAQLISTGYIESLDYQEINSIINNTKQSLALQQTTINKVELAKITDTVKVKRTILDRTKKTEDEISNMIVQVVFPIIILPFFMLSIFLVQMIGAEINDEKSTRGMEIIISNVSPKIHFFSKVISGNIFIILQAILIVIYGLIGMGIRYLLGTGGIDKLLGNTIGNTITSFIGTSAMNQLIMMVPLIILMMVLTFLAYSLLAGVLASMTTNTEDFQQLQTPIMILSLVGYYLSMMAGVFKGALFIKIFAFVPFISAILAPSLMFLGQIGIVEFLIAILLVIIVIYLLIKYGLKIYKVGILNYSSKDLWKKMFKAIKNN